MDNSNSRERIEKLKIQDQKLSEELENLRSNLKMLRNEQVLLLNSNWKLEISVSNLQKENKYLENEIQLKNESLAGIEKHYQQCKSDNDKELRDFRDYFDGESSHYSHLLSNAQKEYDPENLKADIDNYKRQTALLKNDLENMKSEMDELTKKYGLMEEGTNEKVKQIDEIQSIISSLENDESTVLSAIKLYKTKIRNLSKKIEHKEQILSAVTKKNF